MAEPVLSPATSVLEWRVDAPARKAEALPFGLKTLLAEAGLRPRRRLSAPQARTNDG